MHLRIIALKPWFWVWVLLHPFQLSPPRVRWGAGPTPTPPPKFRVKAVKNMVAKNFGYSNKTRCGCFVWKLEIGTIIIIKKHGFCLKPHLQPRQRWLAQYSSSHFFCATSSHVCSHLPWKCQNKNRLYLCVWWGNRNRDIISAPWTDHLPSNAPQTFQESLSLCPSNLPVGSMIFS